MLSVDAQTFELSAPLAHFAEHGYARLGRVLGAEGLEALRERADDLMLGRVSYPGFFWQMDAPSGRYADAPLGLGWQGPSLDYRKLEKLEKDPRFLAWMENPLFERLVRALIPGDVVALPGHPLPQGPARRQRGALAPGRGQVVGPHPGPRAAGVDGPG